jgi:hypothetical protein
MTRKSNDEANRIYQYVINELGRITGTDVQEKEEHVLYVPSPFDWSLYTRASTSGFWGLSPNKADYVRRTYPNRWSILLVSGSIRKMYDDSDDYEKIVLKGIYCISPELYDSRSPFWTKVRNEYRINEGNRDLLNVNALSSLEMLTSKFRS